MHITAGLGSIDEYIPYIKAGAEELFCGYVPFSWQEKYGNLFPMNRREVIYYNVQIGSESEMKILRKMADRYEVPVTITLNALSYLPEQYPLLLSYMQACRRLGFDRFIIADHALLVYLQQQDVTGEFHIHVSGELGEMNTEVIEACRRLGAERVIYHRKVTICAMKQMQEKHPTLEYEAFLMNEMCHFHGGFCNSLHCDELSHMCLVPYRLGKAGRKDSNDFGCESGNGGGNVPGDLGREEREDDSTVFCDDAENDIPGFSGCGLCALPKLQAAGVKWLKVVSRGGRTEDTIRDIRAARQAIDLLEQYPEEKAYIEQMKKQIFPNGCGRNCYYRQ